MDNQRSGRVTWFIPSYTCYILLYISDNNIYVCVADATLNQFYQIILYNRCTNNYAHIHMNVYKIDILFVNWKFSINF